MKTTHIISAIFLSILFSALSCKKEKNALVVNQDKEAVKKEKGQSNKTAVIAPSANYEALLNNYSCKMTIPELAKVLEVPEADLGISDIAAPPDCYFTLQGYGKEIGGDSSLLHWGIVENHRDNIKGQIKEYHKILKLPEGIRQGMGIQLAATKDCYIAYQPTNGRVIILNGNYDNSFVLHYGAGGIQDRSKAQSAELQSKIIALANYLLQKHKK